ncbi:MAG TPA: ParB/RepB/Spo0J family partition protein [Candidatus Paceibacterota bacterium]|nr:ParB/RepB/Spo0J family partition protein [Candidatus Paceibacterota bacterium]
MSTLGRGLESLIPPNNRPADTDATPPSSGPTNEPAASPAQPVKASPFEPVVLERITIDAAVPAEESKSEPPRSEPVVTESPIVEPPAQTVSRLPAEPPRARGVVRPSAPKAPEAVFHIEVEKIVPNPDQPRRAFDEEALKELAASIREFGLLQPITVAKVEREVPTGTHVEYQIISGERRYLASKMLGLERIPAIIRNLTYNRESLELAVIENIQRENLNPIELARAYARLQDEFRLTQREIAARLGKSREVVANSVRLLDLSADIQKALEEGVISESHGRLLLTIDDPALQQKLFRDLVENRLTTRELRSKAEAAAPRGAGHERFELPPELKMLQEKLSSELGAPVSIHRSGSSGRITINFYSEEELQSIVQKLGEGEES